MSKNMDLVIWLNDENTKCKFKMEDLDAVVKWFGIKKSETKYSFVSDSDELLSSKEPFGFLKKLLLEFETEDIPLKQELVFYEDTVSPRPLLFQLIGDFFYVISPLDIREALKEVSE